MKALSENQVYPSRLQHRKYKEKVKKGNTLSLSTITLCVLLVVTFIIITARLSLVQKNVRLTSSSRYIEAYKDAEKNSNLNAAERKITLMLLNLPQTRDNIALNKITTYTIFYKTIINCFLNDGFDMNEVQASKIESLISEIYSVMQLEGQSDFNEMSLDGKEVAVNIAGQIYELCSLKLEIDLEGNIQRISASSGEIIYTIKDQVYQAEFQIYTFMMILVIIAALLIICFIIAKKNQLFRKGEKYGGFDEKEFA